MNVQDAEERLNWAKEAQREFMQKTAEEYIAKHTVAQGESTASAIEGTQEAAEPKSMPKQNSNSTASIDGSMQQEQHSQSTASIGDGMQQEQQQQQQHSHGQLAEQSKMVQRAEATAAGEAGWNAATAKSGGHAGWNAAVVEQCSSGG